MLRASFCLGWVCLKTVQTGRQCYVLYTCSAPFTRASFFVWVVRRTPPRTRATAIVARHKLPLFTSLWLQDTDLVQKQQQRSASTLSDPTTVQTRLAPSISKAPVAQPCQECGDQAQPAQVEVAIVQISQLLISHRPS